MLTSIRPQSVDVLVSSAHAFKFKLLKPVNRGLKPGGRIDVRMAAIDEKAVMDSILADENVIVIAKEDAALLVIRDCYGMAVEKNVLP